MATALGHFAPPAATTRLLELLADRDVEVQTRAIIALANRDVDGPAAAPIAQPGATDVTDPSIDGRIVGVLRPHVADAAVRTALMVIPARSLGAPALAHGIDVLLGASS
ncbi:MAG: hypothetical protein JNK64_26425 [Myxococcales bacterium]|nr:hypothetical protein [Myxococcales bacterium]